MNDTGRRAAFALPNPFPRVPLVTLGFGDERRITVETAAVRDVHDFEDKHVGQGGGRSLAIVGDYEAGKRHLAAELIYALRSEDPGAFVCAVRARREDTLHSLYQRIFEQAHAQEDGDRITDAVRELEVRRRIGKLRDDLQRQRYAAAWPGKTPESIFPQPDGPDVTSDIELAQALLDRLFEIVSDREFASGLSLLLHDDPDIAGHAWDWLRGGPVTSDIAKRGVEEPIDNEPRAMVAMLVLARLFNRTRGRFALVMDDVQLLGGGAEDPHHQLASALILLVRWAADSGSLLVIAGLERTWRGLPEGVRQRVGRVIRPGPFTPANIADYQRKVYQDRDVVGGPRFTKGAFVRLHDITAGSPLRVVDGCYHAFERARGGGVITASLIEHVSNDIFVQTPPPAEAAGRISELCARLGQHAQPVRTIGDRAARLWIPLGRDGAGCSIVITGPVLNPASADRLRRLAGPRGEDTSQPGRVAVLVCTGPLAESQREPLRNAFSAVLSYDDDEFEHDLGALISNLSQQAGTSLLAELREDLRGLRAHQAGEHEYLRRLASSWEENEKQLRAVVRAETRRAYLRLPGNADVLDFGDGFPGLQAIFDRALSAIREALERVEQLWGSMFLSREPTRLIDRSKAPGSRDALPSDLTPEPMIRSLGVLTALDSSLRGFGNAVIGSLQQEQAEGRSARTSLNHQCSRFDQAVDDLALLMPSSDGEASSVVDRVLGVDLGRILSTLKGLGARVYDEVYKRDFHQM